MPIKVEICSICGKHARVGLQDGATVQNIACKESGIFFIHSIISPERRDMEASKYIEQISESTLPKIDNASVEIMWSIEICNHYGIYSTPEKLCDLINYYHPKNIPDKFMEKAKEYFKIEE